MNGLLHRVAIPPRLRDFGPAGPDTQAFDVAWDSGRVTRIEPVPGAAQATVLSAPVDVHVHIDKNYTVDEVGETQGDLGAAIEKMKVNRSGWTAAQVRGRMARALDDAWRCGTRALRTHLDWSDPQAPLSFEVLLDLREDWRDRIELQFVSLTPLERFDEQGAAAERARTLAATGGILGAFVYRNVDLQAKLRRVFELAAAHGLALDLHVDEGLDADAVALSCVADLVAEFGMQGRVTCGHACSLSMQPTDQALDTLGRCALADIHLVALPTTNLYLQGSWDGTPRERGITRLREARAAGVNVCIATDNVADGFFPYGSYDLLETFGLGVQLAHLADAASWLPVITSNPARAMGLQWDGLLRVGCPADLVALKARTPYDMLTPQGRQRTVYRGGRALA